MNKIDNTNNKQDVALTEKELMLLSEGVVALEDVDVNSVQMQSLRSRVMMQIDEQPLTDISDLLTVKSDDGDWQQISDDIRKKILYVDKQRGMESYLLRIKPGTKVDSHQHSSDEHCLVLEGEISFGDIHLHAGDYHLAPKGSWHEKAYCTSGALLYIQSGVEQHVSI